MGAGSNAAIAAAASQAIAATQQVCMFNDNITLQIEQKKLLSMLRFCFQDTYLLEIKVRHLKSNP